METIMSTLHPHPHAATDRYPGLVQELTAEHGSEGIGAAIDRVVAAELDDFCWEARFAERALGSVAEDLDDNDAGSYERVGILGYFRGRYHVATCIEDADRRLYRMLRVRYFEDYEAAKSAFATLR